MPGPDRNCSNPTFLKHLQFYPISPKIAPSFWQNPHSVVLRQQRAQPLPKQNLANRLTATISSLFTAQNLPARHEICSYRKVLFVVQDLLACRAKS
jgi:hypothetical protein